MPPTAVDWQPALVVLAAGLVLGALLVWWVSRRGGAAAPPAPEAPPVELRDQEGKLAALLRQLRELDDQAAKRTPEQLARERYAIELEAARTLLARDALAAEREAATKAAEPATAPASGGSGRGFLWGVASSLAVGLLLFFVWQSAERRPEGGSVTGETPGAPTGAAPAAAPEDDETRALRARLAQSPEDHDLRLQLARQLLMQRDLMGVWNETQHVLEHEPGHPRALAYQALVRLAMGQGELAVTMLQQAISADPDLLEARQNLAFVYASLGRTKEAEAAVAEVRKRSPEDADRLQQALSQLGEARAAQAEAATGEDPHQGVAPPAVASGAAPAPAAGGAAPAATSRPGRPAGVFGWIETDASVAARIRPGTVVFLTVREAGVAQGPPVAVKRLEAAAFPLQFELGTGDSMMGQPLPERMRIDARADSDGDPMTRPDSDPKGFADGVELGRTGVRIPLK